MPLNDALTAFLTEMAASGVKPIAESTPEEVRALTASLAELYGSGPEMERVEDHTIPVEGGSIAARVLVPPRKAARRVDLIPRRWMGHRRQHRRVRHTGAQACRPDPMRGRPRRLPIGLLSGGEQQMLSLARGLCRNPHVLLADELSMGLAPMVVTRLLEAVRRAADEQGTAVLLVEQHVRQALRYADSAYVMRRGRIELAGTAAELIGRVAEIEDSYLTSAVK